jgi:hypothetical protein
MPEGDGVDMTASAATNTAIRGRLLKFADKMWTVGSGRSMQEVDHELRLVVLRFACAWVKWLKAEGTSRPVEYRFQFPGQPFPTTSDNLPDRDQSKWSRDDRDDPVDPWQFTRFIYFADPKTGEEYTYSSGSYSGKKAVTDLSVQVRNMRDATGRKVMPVIGLAWVPWQTTYKLTSRPVFEVHDWIGGSNIEPPPPQLSSRSHEEEEPSAEKSFGEEISDNIPF